MSKSEKNETSTNAVQAVLDEIRAHFGQSNVANGALADFQPGDKIMVQSITFFWVGELKAVVNGYVILDKASWIADTGAVDQCMNKGTLAEKATLPNHSPRISLQSIVAVLPWTAALPK